MKNKKRNYPYLIILIIFLIITFLAPRTGDDWGNYLEGTLGIKNMILQTFRMYFDWEGRLVSRLLINFLTYYKPLWNIINSILITSTIYLMVKIIKPKNKKITFLTSTIIILLMNIKTFSEVVVWIAGNITYFFIIPLLLFYFNYIMNHQNNNKKTITTLILLNIIMTMFIEHMAVILVLGNILILLSRYLKTKKIDKELILYIIFSLFGLILMLLSPGSTKRACMELEFKNLSIMEKIFYNLPNFIYYTFTVNYTLIPLLVLANYYLVRKQIKNKSLRAISYLYLLIVPIINALVYLYQNIFYTNISISNNPFLILYFISYILINLVLIYTLTKKDKVNKTLFFYLLGIASNFVMLISPTWGYRTSLSTYIFLGITYLLIIDRYIIENKLLNYTLTGICLLSTIFNLTLYTSVHLQSKANEKRIKEALQEEKDIIEIERFPSFVSCNINPENDFHLEKFKAYYNIPQEKEIIIIPNNWKYQIVYKEK